MNQEIAQSTTATTAESVGLSDQAKYWLADRSLKWEVAQALGLTSFRDATTEFIQLPYGTDRWKRRALGDKSKQYSSGGELPLFNSEALQITGMPLLLTEGEWDCLAAVQSSYARATSLPNGANSLTETVYDSITEAVSDNEIVIIAADSDKDGQKMLADVSRRLGRSRCKFITYPYTDAGKTTRCKDLNEVLELYGEAAVKQVIDNAEFVHVPGLYKMSDLPDLAEKELYSLNINGLDKVKIRKGDWSIWTGIPGNGKTSFVNAVTCEMIASHNWKIAYASFEQEPQTDHRENLRRWFLGTDPAFAKAGRLGEADKWIDENMLFFVPDEDQDISLEWLYEMMSVAVKRHGVDMIVIDPWNEIDHSRGNNETQTEYTGAVIRHFRRFARANNIHLAIVAHPAKMSPDKDGNLRVPTLYDVSDSAHWNNKCDIGIIVHRDVETNEAIIRIEKCRYGSKLGLKNREDFYLEFIVQTNRYRQSSIV